MRTAGLDMGPVSKIAADAPVNNGNVSLQGFI